MTDDELRSHLETIAGRKCLPEGELHVCWLIEQSLSPARCYSYQGELQKLFGPWKPQGDASNWLWNASWQQRAEALIKVMPPKATP